MPTNRARPGGSGYTWLTWNNNIITYCKTFTLGGITPVADSVPIHPINADYPVEIMTAGASNHGTLTVTLTDIAGQAPWSRLPGLENAQNIVDVMRTIQAMSGEVIIRRYMMPPFATTPSSGYVESYHNCIVNSATDEETIAIATLEIEKSIEFWYTYSIKDYINGGNTANNYLWSTAPVISGPSPTTPGTVV